MNWETGPNGIQPWPIMQFPGLNRSLLSGGTLPNHNENSTINLPFSPHYFQLASVLRWPFIFPRPCTTEDLLGKKLHDSSSGLYSEKSFSSSQGECSSTSEQVVGISLPAKERRSSSNILEESPGALKRTISNNSSISDKDDKYCDSACILNFTKENLPTNNFDQNRVPEETKNEEKPFLKFGVHAILSHTSQPAGS